MYIPTKCKYCTNFSVSKHNLLLVHMFRVNKMSAGDEINFISYKTKRNIINFLNNLLVSLQKD